VRTYPLRDGMSLVVVQRSGQRVMVTFHADDFADVEAATGEEVAAVLEREGVSATVDADGTVSLAPPRGGGAPSAVDVDASTAAEALGLDRPPAPAAAPAAAPAPSAPTAPTASAAHPARAGAAPRRTPTPARAVRKIGAAGAAKAAPTAGTPHLMVHNLTGNPIQLVMVTRTLEVPGGGSAALSPAEAAHRPLQRLAESGAVRLAFGPADNP
jgi:hypothetical protein